MIQCILILLAGFIIGKIYTKRKSRLQCLNCGSHNTHASSSGWGGGGGEYKFAVKTWEGHWCKDCGKLMSVKIKLTDHTSTRLTKKQYNKNDLRVALQEENYMEAARIRDSIKANK